MKSKIKASFKAITTGSLHSENNPNMMRMSRKQVNTVCPWVSPTYGHSGRTHSDLAAAIILNARGESVRLEHVTPLKAGRADLTTNNTVFEFKSKPDLYSVRAGIMQVRTYCDQFKLENAALMLPADNRNIFRFKGWGQENSRALIISLAEKYNVKLIAAPRSDTPAMEVDEEGYVNAFSLAKETGISIFHIYNEAELGTLEYKKQQRKREILKVSYEKVKKLFRIK